MELIMRIILIVFIILVFALSLALVIVSGKNKILVKHSDGTVTKERNYPGLYSGSIILVVSFGFLIVNIFGSSLFNYFTEFYIFIIGAMFLFVFVMLIIGLNKKTTEHFTPSGVCMKDGQLGYIDNGVCIINKVGSKSLEECEKKRKECERESREGGNEEFGGGNGRTDIGKINGERTRRSKMNGNPVYGICVIKEGDDVKFGYRHPNFGRRCLTTSQMEKVVKDTPSNGREVRNVRYDYNPFQSTQCYGFPKDDLLKYDLKCKDNFGKDYGLKKIENFGCPENDNRAICDQNYQMGEEMDEDSTKCVPMGTDMNMVCQRKNLREKKTKYIKMGYKEIKFSGCPEGTQRAICNGNYYDGKELYEDTTDPFPQTQNPDRKCKEKCGLLSFSKGIISDNCVVGYVRAQCSN